MSDTLKDAATAALAAIQETLEAAYHRHFQECCGNGTVNGCCGNPVEAWTPEDRAIMNVLGPVEKSLRAAIAARDEQITALTHDRDSWREQADERAKDAVQWLERVRELEAGLRRMSRCTYLDEAVSISRALLTPPATKEPT